MDFSIFVFCINSRSCFFFKALHHMDHSNCKAGIFLQVQTAEVLLAVMTQGAIALLILVHADEAFVLPSAPGRVFWLHTQLV